MSIPVIEACHLNVRHGTASILSDVSSQFKAGTVSFLIGPNGAGKSTFLEALLGIVPAFSGNVFLNGAPIGDYSIAERAKYLAYVPQRLEALPPVRVIDFVMQGTFAWHDMANGVCAEQSQRAQTALEMLELSDLSQRRLDTLSGGERQLCVLASAIAQNAKAILLDEPTSALDFKHVRIFANAIEMLKAQGIVIIISCHDLNFIARYCDVSIVLSHGKIHGIFNGMAPMPVLARAFGVPEAFLCDLEAFSDERKPSCIPEIQAISLAPRSVYAFSNSSQNFTQNAHWPKRIALIGLFVALAMAPWFGATWSMPWEDGMPVDIFWQLRVPRVLWGAITGGVLAVVGAAFQALFQNPLATPYTLGIASGASLGAMIAIQLGIVAAWCVPFAACIGGVAMMAVVIGISAKLGIRSIVGWLMAGVAVSMFCSALGLFLQAFASPMTAQQMMRWQLGGVEIVGYDALKTVPLIVISLFGLFKKAVPLNLMSVDCSLALSRGVDVKSVRLWTLACACLATSLVVSVSGPIGFVGLIIPYVLRRHWGADLKIILPQCALWGAIAVVVADTVSRIFERVAWLPVGVVIALFGAPLFIAFVLRRPHGLDR